MCLEWMERSGDSAGSMASFLCVPRKADTVLASVINLTGVQSLRNVLLGLPPQTSRLG